MPSGRAAGTSTRSSSTATSRPNHPPEPGTFSPVRVTTFGGLAVDLDGVSVDLGPPKQRAVLALLSLEAGRTIPTDRIVDLLWDDDGRKERSALQAYVSNLRRALEPGRERGSPDSVVALRAPGYVLDIDED